MAGHRILVPVVEVRILTGELEEIMAKVKKRRPKKTIDVNAPDEFQETMARVAPFFERHGGKVLIGFVVLLIVIAGVYVGIKLAKAHEVETRAALQTRLNKVLNAVLTGDTDTAKKDLNTVQGDTVAAMMIKASAEYVSGDFEKAAQTYNQVLAKLSPADPLRSIILEAMTTSLIRAGKLADALEKANQLVQGNDPLFKNVGEVLSGDINNPVLVKKALSKDSKTAITHYEKALKGFHKAKDLMASGIYGNLTALRLIDSGK